MSMVLRPPGSGREKLRLAKHIRLRTEERGRPGLHGSWGKGKGGSLSSFTI